MEIILLEDVTGLGKRGATVRVADGYARNFLLPRKKAITAVGNSQAVFRDRERAVMAREQRVRQEMTALRDRLM
ncbi:MAG TPA: 50S ribosomal protein L9, partial [Candidatus Eisenbacteria bacterium]|nr:50S ribosomal protein L9 [Candidatus Eisenbacteria bacterium]